MNAARRHVVTDHYWQTAAGMAETKRLRRQGLKWCGHCRQIKPLQDFAKNAARVDGLQSVCTPCRKHTRRSQP